MKGTISNNPHRVVQNEVVTKVRKQQDQKPNAF